MTTTHDDKASEREQFEQFADSLELDLTRVHAGDEEVYSDCNTDYAWLAWQAGRAALSPASSTGQGADLLQKLRQATDCIKAVKAADIAGWSERAGFALPREVRAMLQNFLDGHAECAAPAQQVAEAEKPVFIGIDYASDYLAEIRDKALEEAAEAVKDHNREGREWVPGSLWDTLTNEASARIRALKSVPQDGWISEIQKMRALVADDSFATSFQSMGQYRTSLLSYIDRCMLDAPSPTGSEKGVGK